ncbi:hypothetical protein [Polyangium jinanense]|uniref:Uncharacterized protein n=1 Tax=Polyangium jinanense TaxID=2829994 RepID=A0A9X4AY47_9BACT|nr:hypothetical protein [Polyangium jinanense]MDC3962711.1 hypothetical protein [Polyangium jinanense]MDC3986975.1 hypothetical protein [Polyangium jinanense]
MTSKNASRRPPCAKRKSKRTRAVAALALGALGGLFLLRRGEIAAHTPHATVAIQGHETNPVIDREVAPTAPRLSLEAPAETATQDEEPATPSSDEWDDNPLGDLLRNIVDKDKNVGTFLYYYEHVLLDRESRKQYEKLLSDQTMYAEVKQGLLHPGETRETLQGNMTRMVKIDYLREALVWGENPSHEALLDTIEQILLADNFTEEMGTDMRLSIATNKMELYALLFDHAPERAAGVVQAAKGTRLEALIDFIANSIAQRRKNELSLATEVRP